MPSTGEHHTGAPRVQNPGEGVESTGVSGTSGCDRGRRLPPGSVAHAAAPVVEPGSASVVAAPAGLCRVLKDPKRNAGKTPEQLVKHVAEDKLVLWGWEPGGQRAPVSVPHSQFVGAFKDWVSGGMPCPAR